MQYYNMITVLFSQSQVTTNYKWTLINLGYDVRSDTTYG